MSSMQPIDEMFALRSKIAALEIKQKMQRRAQKSGLMKIQAVLENEKNDREVQRKLLKNALALETEKRDRQIENERRDLEQKLELIKTQAAMEHEKRDFASKVLLADGSLESLVVKPARLRGQNGHGVFHLLVDLLLLLFKVRRERCLKSVETLLVAASSLVDVLSKLHVAVLEARSELGLACFVNFFLNLFLMA